ncbi:MAG: type II toxin-antitoxin system HicA family toxin [Candidatus Methanoperedens sp.]|nr:type II toxin-antitoxin system HicA family toxin [Candidatus Methanoperedens sp.]MCZ7370143.1 type II toxin-antitoxin system HicA family toxin [Candidatus Methanoperedens sp.]
MTQKTPVVSGNQLIKVLHKLGDNVVKQRGSHIKLRKYTAAGAHSLTVPSHDEIAKGTLNDILNKVSIWNQISKEELIEMLKEV